MNANESYTNRVEQCMATTQFWKLSQSRLSAFTHRLDHRLMSLIACGKLKQSTLRQFNASRFRNQTENHAALKRQLAIGRGKSMIMSVDNFNLNMQNHSDELNSKCKLNDIVEMEMFRHITPSSSLHHLLSNCDYIDLPPMSTVTQQGKCANYIYFILDGSCELSRKPSTSFHREQQNNVTQHINCGVLTPIEYCAVLSRGRCCGEECVLSYHHHHSAMNTNSVDKKRAFFYQLSTRTQSQCRLLRVSTNALYTNLRSETIRKMRDNISIRRLWNEDRLIQRDRRSNVCTHVQSSLNNGAVDRRFIDQNEELNQLRIRFIQRIGEEASKSSFKEHDDAIRDTMNESPSNTTTTTVQQQLTTPLKKRMSGSSPLHNSLVAQWMNSVNQCAAASTSIMNDNDENNNCLYQSAAQRWKSYRLIHGLGKFVQFNEDEANE